MKRKVIDRKRLTLTQETVLRNLFIMKWARIPKDCLEILSVKGLAFGDIKKGWVITPEGSDWIKQEDLLVRNKSNKWKWSI